MTFAVELETKKADEGFFRRAENWLDDRGKGAWIAVMVLGFIFFWPVGLALLAYMIWSKRMFSKGCAQRAHHRHAGFSEAHRTNARHGFRTSGNTAFDAYKAETLKRLMDEQEQFEAFLDRLRAAKDKSEFDEFMNDRAKSARDNHTADDDDGETLEEPKS